MHVKPSRFYIFYAKYFVNQPCGGTTISPLSILWVLYKASVSATVSFVQETKDTPSNAIAANANRYFLIVYISNFLLVISTSKLPKN